MVKRSTVNARVGLLPSIFKYRLAFLLHKSLHLRANFVHWRLAEIIIARKSQVMLRRVGTYLKHLHTVRTAPHIDQICLVSLANGP